MATTKTCDLCGAQAERDNWGTFELWHQNGYVHRDLCKGCAIAVLAFLEKKDVSMVTAALKS